MDEAEIAAVEETLDPSIIDIMFPADDTPEKKRPEPSSEFRQSTDQDLKQLKDLNVTSHTALSTQTWLRCFSKWATMRGLLILEVFRKDSWTAHFNTFMQNLQKQTEMIESESLKVMLTALIDTYVNIVDSVLEFADSRKVLNGKVISFAEERKGEMSQ